MQENEVEDALDESMWSKIDMRVKTNTVCYRKIFGCWPDNLMTTYKEVDEIRNKADISQYDSLKDSIKGIVVEMPLQFLKNEDLEQDIGLDIKALVPLKVYT